MITKHINKDIYLKDIFESKIHIPCGNCGGRLIFANHNGQPVVFLKDPAMQEILLQHGWDVMYGNYANLFCGVGKCRNCDQQFILSGESTIREYTNETCPTSDQCAMDAYENSDPEFMDYGEHTHSNHRIKYIEPSIDIFPIDYLKNEKFGSVYKLMKEAFGLYWFDENSCANRIRLAIEEFNMISNIKGYKDENMKVISSDLDTLNDFGTAGSHARMVNISREDIINALDVLNQALIKYFKINEEYEKGIAERRAKLKKYSKKTK